MLSIRVYSFFIKSLFLYYFSKNKYYHIAISQLLYGHTYRTPSSLSDYKAPFTYYLQSIKLVFKNKSLNHKSNSRKAIYSIDDKHKTTCLDYAKFIKLDVNSINEIVRDNPNIDLNFIDKINLILLNSFLFPFLLLYTPFAKKSKSIAIITLELTEAVFLLKSININQTDYLYYFSPYEKDANWITLLLKQEKVFCHKIPSSNALKNAYSKMIADKFSFTAPFQIYEYSLLKENWIVNQFSVFPNVGAHYLKEYTIEKKGQAPKMTLGIFTRGIWLRKMRGDNFLGVGEDRAEELMLECLRDVISLKQFDQVYLLLHPTERKTKEQFEMSKKYYQEFFSSDKIKIVDSDTQSFQLFSMFDIGVASISSVIFERLHCGFKCILAPINMKVKLFDDRNLEYIVANNKSEFLDKLKKIQSIDSETYFNEFNLQDYRITDVSEVNLKF